MLTQLSAVYLEDEEKSFSQYILPSKPVTESASRITGLSVQVHNGQRVLTLNGDIVPSNTEKAVLSEFSDWLPKNAVLLAHNGRSFDNPRLMRACKRSDVELSSSVVGLGDTLPLSHKAFPDENSHSLKILCKSLFDYSYNAHDALADCKALQKVTSHALDQDGINLCGFVHNLKSYIEDTEYKIREKSNLQSFLPMIENKVISKQLAEKMAGSGIEMGHLVTVYKRKGFDGLSAVLKAKGRNGKGARVTNKAATISAIHDYIEKSND